MTDYDVVVCGAGVAGLLAARALELAGLRVLVLDKQRELRPILRGELLQPRCQQILGALGVLAAVHERDPVRVPRLACRDGRGRELVGLDYQALPEPQHILSLEYATIQSCVTDVLGAQVLRGAVVTSLLHDAHGRVSGVRAKVDGRERDITATLVVAADGRTSALRHAAGIPVEVRQYPHELAAFELSTPDGVAPEVTAYISDRGLRLVYPLPGGRTRLYAQVPRGEFRSQARDGLAGWWSALLADTPALKPFDEGPDRSRRAQVLPVWRFSAPSVTRPGLVLIGEAARCMHPMAAQGMSAAALDAALLAEMCGELGSWQPADVDAALLAFQRRQWWPQERAELSHKIAAVFTATSWRGRLVSRRLVRRAMRDAGRRRRLTSDMAGLEQAM